MLWVVPTSTYATSSPLLYGIGAKVRSVVPSLPGHGTQCRSPDPPISVIAVAQSWNLGLPPGIPPFAQGTHEGLFRPLHIRLVIGWYVRPHYIPTLPPHHQHKTYHVQAVVSHPLDLPSLLLPPHKCDADPMSDLHLCHPYVIASALTRMDPFHQIFLL